MFLSNKYLTQGLPKFHLEVGVIPCMKVYHILGEYWGKMGSHTFYRVHTVSKDQERYYVFQ